MSTIETVEKRGLFFENDRLYQVEVHSVGNKPPYMEEVDVTEQVTNVILNTIQGKGKLWKDAEGEKLPEYDREVIALVRVNSGNKVVYAHRPNPNGWDGKNIDTGEVSHYEPKLYGKGGWNQPDVKWWLDLNMPE